MKTFKFTCDKCGNTCQHGDIRKITVRTEHLNPLGDPHSRPAHLHFFDLCDRCYEWLYQKLDEAVTWAKGQP